MTESSVPKSAMTIDQAKLEMLELKKRLDSAINEFHQRTGLAVDIYIQQLEVTRFGDAGPKYLYEANVSMQLVAAGEL